MLLWLYIHRKRLPTGIRSLKKIPNRVWIFLGRVGAPYFRDFIPSTSVQKPSSIKSELLLQIFKPDYVFLSALWSSQIAVSAKYMLITASKTDQKWVKNQWFWILIGWNFDDNDIFCKYSPNDVSNTLQYIYALLETPKVNFRILNIFDHFCISWIFLQAKSWKMTPKKKPNDFCKTQFSTKKNENLEKIPKTCEMSIHSVGIT